MAETDTSSEHYHAHGTTPRAEFLHDRNAQTAMETPDTDIPNIDGRTRQLWVSYLLALPPHGLFGAYHYYLHRRKMGIVFSCSVGIFGLGWFIDLVRMYWLVRRVNRDYAKSLTDPVYMDDVYMVWFPLGFIGAHRFYLGSGHYRAAVLCALTLGVFGVGWLVDGIVLSCYVKDKQNELDIAYHIESNEPPPYQSDQSLPSNEMDQIGHTHVEEIAPPDYSSVSITEQLPTYDSLYSNEIVIHI